MVSSKQSKRLLESVENNFLVQILDSPTTSETLLGLALVCVKETFKEVKFRSSLGCSEHDLVKFTIWRNMGLARVKSELLNFRRVDFRMFKELFRNYWMRPLGSCPRGYWA